ncbi:MAG: HNH endonuclease [Rhodospirillales bacterium]|nr:HNH endonuclease [Rhodospirillales bacterium]
MAFDSGVVAAVWDKATYVNEANEKKGFRKDQCGAWINRSDYGDRNSKWGWEIDHVTPVSKEGPDDISNLRPLHWENNVAKSDDQLVCVVTSKSTQNVTT